MKTYRLSYSVKNHDPGVPGDWLKERNLGGCDHLVLASIIGRPGANEPCSIAFLSLDGETGGPVSVDALFHVWVHLAKAIAEETPGTARGAMCKVFETVCAAILAAREGGS